MPENLELLRKSRGAQRGVATKLYNEADGIMNKPFTLINEDDLIRLQQIDEDVNFNHSHRRQLRCCNGNFAEPIRQQEIDTSSPHPWNCLISTSFTQKHTGITKTCRHNGGAQTFSSEHGTTS